MSENKPLCYFCGDENVKRIGVSWVFPTKFVYLCNSCKRRFFVKRDTEIETELSKKPVKYYPLIKLLFKDETTTR